MSFTIRQPLLIANQNGNELPRTGNSVLAPTILLSASALYRSLDPLENQIQHVKKPISDIHKLSSFPGNFTFRFQADFGQLSLDSWYLRMVFPIISLHIEPL